MIQAGIGDDEATSGHPGCAGAGRRRRPGGLTR
jgi:hypothetical protein